MSERPIRTRVHRAPAVKTWEREHKWGTSFGDVTTLYVRRTDGGNLTVSYGSDSIEIRAALVEAFAEMVMAAAHWTDETTVDVSRGGVSDAE